jgi:hypothetical protein
MHYHDRRKANVLEKKVRKTTHHKSAAKGTVTFIVFWFVYGVVAVCVLYQALPRLNRELLLILGGAAIFPVVTTFTFLLYARSRSLSDFQIARS